MLDKVLRRIRDRALVSSALTRALIGHRKPWALKDAIPQDASKYTLFNDQLLQIDESYSREEVFGTSLFADARQAALSKTKKIDALRLAFWTSALFTLFLLVYTFLTSSLMIAGLALVFALTCIWSASVLVKLVSMNTGLTRAELIAKAKDPIRTKLIIERLERGYFGKHDFAIMANDGRFKQLPYELPRVENGLVFLLGEIAHRDATIYVGEPPSGDLYISKAKATKDSRSTKVTLDFLRNKTAVSELVAIVENHHPFDPAKPKSKLSVQRTRWVNLLRLSLNDWKKWTALQLKGINDVEFENSLIQAIRDRKKTDTEMSEMFNIFVEGKNRNFRNWLVELDFIDDVTYRLNSEYNNITTD